MFDEGGYDSPFEVFGSRKTNMINNKRRFTDEQVKSLELIFENETKLDPKKKVHVARDLGLEPRQVAIWFQNKRARYKSKQIEKDFIILRSNYNELVNLFEEVKKEKESLVFQLETLRDMAKDQGDKNKYSNANYSTNSVESRPNEDERSESENNNHTSTNNSNNQYQIKQTLSLEESEQFRACSILSDEGSSENTNYFRPQNQSKILTMLQIDGSLTSSERWDDFGSDDLFDQAVDSCQWWESWSSTIN